jgi:hypothetical protein
MGFLSLRQRSKSFNEAYPPSATATIWRLGYQRLTSKSICQARSVSGLWRLAHSSFAHSSFAWRSEGARTERNGKAQTLEVQGTGASSVRHAHLRARVFTKWP